VHPMHARTVRATEHYPKVRPAVTFDGPIVPVNEPPSTEKAIGVFDGRSRETDAAA